MQASQIEKSNADLTAVEFNDKGKKIKFSDLLKPKETNELIAVN